MSIFKRFIAMILVCVCSINILSTSVYAKECDISPYSLDGTTETVIIENITYRYDYYYIDGNRITKITNLNTNEIDTVLYVPIDGLLYLNDEVIGAVGPLGYTADGWQIMGSDAILITWGTGVAVAIVAGAISAGLGNLGAAGVIAAMGTTALSVLDASCVGGTIYRQLHMYPNPIQYRYQWRFRAPTGTYYGPYYYTV